MFHWQFSSRHDRPKSWYIIALIVVIFLVVYGIWEGTYLMPIAAFLFAGVYMLIENNGTPLTDVEVNSSGITVQGTFYEYSKIASYAIIYDQGVARVLRLMMRKGITATIDIPLVPDIDAPELKVFLATYITEDPHAEFTKSDRVIQAMRL